MRSYSLAPTNASGRRSVKQSNKEALCLFVSNTSLEQHRHKSKTKIPLYWQEDLKMVRRSGLLTMESTACLSCTAPKRRQTPEWYLNAIHLSRNHNTIIVKSDDTDVLVLLIYYASRRLLGTASIFMHAGHRDRQRYITVSDISEKLGVALSESLPACHALTGCDTTSSLFRIGKTTAFNKLEKHMDEIQGLRTFGLTDSLPEAVKCAR